MKKALKIKNTLKNTVLYLKLCSVNMTYSLKKINNPIGVCMYLYLFTSTAWKFICTVCSTEYLKMEDS